MQNKDEEAAPKAQDNTGSSSTMSQSINTNQFNKMFVKSLQEKILLDQTSAPAYDNSEVTEVENMGGGVGQDDM